MENVGKPPLFKTPEEMQSKIDDYFDTLEIKGGLPTIAELAYFLGFADRRGLLYYHHNKEEFNDTIKKARMRIEMAIEKELITRNGTVTGLIFNLKNNFGWKDTQDIKTEFNTPVKIVIEGVSPENTDPE